MSFNRFQLTMFFQHASMISTMQQMCRNQQVTVFFNRYSLTRFLPTKGNYVVSPRKLHFKLIARLMVRSPVDHQPFPVLNRIRQNRSTLLRTCMIMGTDCKRFLSLPGIVSFEQGSYEIGLGRHFAIRRRICFVLQDVKDVRNGLRFNSVPHWLKEITYPRELFFTNYFVSTNSLHRYTTYRKAFRQESHTRQCKSRGKCY
jgi:hypothetical protein